MATITTRSGKGSALTHQEVDANFTGLNTELGQKEVASNKGVANGYASLDAAGKVPSGQLPSYVDDVVEAANLASLPGTGETGKIYVTLDTNKTYRWSGSAYVEISPSPGSTDSLAEGSTNLYFTQARARASVSASGSLSYNSSTGVFSFSDAVTSVAGRTGAVTLTSSDVGLGNVENKSSATIRGELTSSNVTTALGFTPYNSSNPSGYISGNQTITVSGDASGSGATSIALTLANSGVAAGTYTKVTVDAKGRVTTGASLASGDLPTYTGTITSSQVTTALGYTPYNSSNPSGYITSSALSSYLPLSGETMSGKLKISLGGGTTPSNYLEIANTSSTTGQRAGLQLNTGASWSTTFYTESGNWWHAFGSDVGDFRWGYDGTNLKVGSNTVLHAANYNSYSPTLTGTGASGTWGINVTGSAGSVSWANISAGVRSEYGNLQFQPGASSFSGMRFLDTSGNGAGWFLIRGTSDTDVYTAEGITLVADKGWLTLAQRETAGRGVRIMSGTTSTERIKVTTAGDIQFVNGNSFTYGGNVILHAGNYNSYSPTLTGGGASGTWGISISGSAAQLNGRSVHQIFNNMGQNHGTYTNFNNIPEFGAYYVQGSANGPGTGSEQFYGFTLGLGNEYAYSSYALQIAIPRYNFGAEGGGPDRYISIRSREGGAWNSWQKIRAGYADTAGSVSNGLTTSNYSSYALPLSGGTVSGNLFVTGTIRSTSGVFQLNDGSSTGGGLYFYKTITGSGASLAPSLFAETGMPLYFMNNGSATPKMTLNTSGELSVTSKIYVGGATVNSGYNGIYGTNMVGAASGNRLVYFFNDGSTLKVDAYDYGTSSPLGFTIGGNGGTVNLHTGATVSGNTILHAANYSSYALPLSGGSMTGNISGPAYNSPNFIRFASDNNWAYGCSYDGGSQYWMQVQFYGTGDDTRGFRVLDKNGDAVRFRVNGAGNVTASGNVTAYSDERLKKDWSLIESGFVDRLAVLRCGTYTRIDSGQRQAGVSAQNMREILPEAVSEDNDGTLALAYGNAALVSAVELAKELVALKHKVAELEARVH